VVNNAAYGALDGITDAHRRRKAKINEMNGASGNTTHEFMTNLDARKAFG